MKFLQSLIFILSISVAAYAVFIYGFLELGIAVHPAMKKNFQAHSIGIYAHIFSSMIALLLGPFQFRKSLRIKKPTVHRLIGKFYFVSVLIGSISGFYMSFYSFGGTISHYGFRTLAILWFVTGITAYSAIIKRNVANHFKWIFINFALTFAAVTLRTGLGIGFASGLPFEVFYPYLAWLCWLPNLIAALFLLKNKFVRIEY
jgi:uncharacterized membrane protein